MCNCKRGPRGYNGLSYLDSINYTEIAISSAQILAMDSTEIILLPALASNQYYQFKLALEYTAGSTPYTQTDPWGVYGDACEYVEFKTNSLGADNQVYRVSSENYKNPLLADGEFTGAPVKMYTNGGPAPTLGDGTILAKIWYEVKTFGSEL